MMAQAATALSKEIAGKNSTAHSVLRPDPNLIPGIAVIITGENYTDSRWHNSHLTLVRKRQVLPSEVLPSKRLARSPNMRLSW